MLNGLVRNNRLLILVPFNGPVQFIQHLLPFAGQGSPDPELNAVVESVVYQGLRGGQKFQKQPFLLQVSSSVAGTKVLAWASRYRGAL